IQYHKECYSYILRGDLNNDTLPVLPIEQLELLQKYIEYANSKTSEELVEMVHKYQVFKSRLRSFKNDRVNKNNRLVKAKIVLCDVVTLTAWANNMFSHAR